MTYREFQPNVQLVPYIETYWTAYGFKEKEESYRILPDGCVDIVISLSSSSHFGLKPFVPNIVGAMTTYGLGSYHKTVHLVGIRFRPVGFTAFCRVPIFEFTDKRIDLTLVDSLFDELFYAGLMEKATTEEVIRHIDAYFLGKQELFFNPEPQIVHSVNLIRQSGGILPLSEVAANSCLSLRHFERKFKTAVGVSPKTFSKIIKFQYTCSYLKNNPDLSLFSVAFDCGYYDQAHLIKDFRFLSGRSPSYFKE